MKIPQEIPVETPYLRGVPTPTAGPLWAGFGLSMAFAGLVTNWMVSVIGAIAFIAGLIAWARQCFPEEALEALPAGSEIPLPPPALEHRPATARVMLPVEMHRYRSGFVGGLAGGVAMAIAAVLWGLLREGSVWLPINLLAGIFVPSVDAEDVALLKSFQPGIFAIALAIHGVSCMFVGLLYAVCLPMMPSRPLLMGGLLSPILWTGVLYATIGIVNPVLERFISWPWFFGSQVAFGLVCAIVVSRSKKIRTMAGLSMEQRMGVERNEGGV